MIIKLLESQLEAANATIRQLGQSLSELSAANAELSATVQMLRRSVKDLEALLQERDDSLAKAGNQFRALSKLTESKSERQHPLPPVKFEAGNGAAEEAARKAAERKARGNNGAKRNMHFEMETVERDVYPEGADAIGSVFFRDVIRYKMVPPRFVKEIIHLHTVKVDGSLVSAKAPLVPIQNSSYDGSFVAGIAQLRYLYSMPVERIVSYFCENGFDLDKQTAHGLLKKTASLFENLYGAMRRAVREDSYLCCDETYHRVLVRADDRSGRGSRKGYLWVIAAVHLGLVYFFYDDGSRSERIILDELKGYEGTIQSDGLKAYKKVASQSDGKVQRLACLQHCKRAFLDMKGNPDADEILALANQLYIQEHKHKIGRDGWTVGDNLGWRQEYAPPILEKLKAALLRVQAQTDKYPPKSQMYGAVNYFLNEWDGIEAIVTGGDYYWDNNLVERINRYVSLSRKNSLFFGNHKGAERGCFFYSLACSCRMHKINFFEYLTDVLNKMAQMPATASPEAYRNLLPDRWGKNTRDE